MIRSLWAVIFFFFVGTSNAQSYRFTFTQSKMGSPFSIIFFSKDSLVAEKLAQKSFALVDSLNTIFSDYETNSEVSRLCQHAGEGPLPVSATMMDMLQLSDNAYQKSGGAFDITVGPLSRLWRNARKKVSFPEEQEVAQKKKLVNFAKLLLDTQLHTLTIPVKGMLLDFGGIAKGYTAQAVLNLLQQNGISSALVDAGGDIAMTVAPPGKSGWVIGVNIPETEAELLSKKLTLQNTSVATSGDAFQYLENEGKKYSHIIDPRTGYGIQGQRNVTVIAKDGASADWLATVCSIVPLRIVKKIVKETGAAALITEWHNGKVRYHYFGHFQKYWQK